MLTSQQLLLTSSSYLNGLKTIFINTNTSAMSEDSYAASIDLLRRLDPKNVSRNLTNLCRLVPDLADELLSSVDQPLQYRKCEESGDNFLICDYNRDGDSYRSPKSNNYYPPLSGEDAELAPKPLNDLRELEVFANDSFDIYRDLYYEGGISSVYMWNPNDYEDETDINDITNGFAAAVLFKKESDVSSSIWDSIHVINAEKISPETFIYTLTTTIIMSMEDSDAEQGISLSLSGSLTRQSEKKAAAKSYIDHITNMGTLVEDMESKLRNMIQEVYFSKTRDVVGDLRTINKVSNLYNEKSMQSEVIKGIQGR
ncbi:F-actin-capping protein subunit beta [Saccharomycopsis crataegensis]|uniref:F-actin-capping protein subunit beta n=1 Tax=Saccharomycopsis crataegensis TaxID=43959 RepID=A0AAV5QNN1_9ASCO|nr:F-actin-capping protein subunit beta [Saccharomycopsis crataegensis]